MHKVKALVLAAGKGERMRSQKAKVLHPLVGYPVIHHVLEAVRHAGIEEVHVVVGYQAEQVKAACGEERCHFVTQSEPKGTGDAVLRAREVLSGFEGDIVIVCGDAPLLKPGTLEALVTTHRKLGGAGMVLTGCVDDPSGYGRVVRDRRDGRVLKIVEESDATPQEAGISEINSGTYVFHASKLWENLREVSPNPRKGEIYLTDVVALLCARGHAVYAYRVEDSTEIYGINTRKDLVAATNCLRWRVLQHHLENGVAIVDPSTTYIEMGVEIGEDTTILPFSVIRRGVRIGSRCEVGPFSHLRGNTVIEDEAEIGNFVEVKESKVGRHTKAKHLSYLGDATIGARVNIGAGTITANYDGVKKHKTIVEDGAFTGCHTVLVAPVRMGKNSKTGAGAVVPKNHDIEEGETVVGIPARSLLKRNP